MRYRKPYSIVKETLKGTNITLVSLFFSRGANVYAFSYEKEGKRRHTLIDAGDSYYRNEMLSLLRENGINPAHIERIIITHSHRDHLSLADLLARESKAKILVRESFRSVVEAGIKPERRKLHSDFDASQLKDCDIEYLPGPGKSKVGNVNGVTFSSLTEPLRLGEIGTLEILAPPQSKLTHGYDQALVLYSPSISDPYDTKTRNNWRPTDYILFSGDLWLMRGPVFNWGIRFLSHRFRSFFYAVIKLLFRRNKLHGDYRKQDPQAKDALKNGFALIRVKPGHGEEFLGTRIIPNGLLADRDLLVRLGYSEDSSKAILRQRDMAAGIATFKEQAYQSFLGELIHWLELGYATDEVSALLVRIYKEQSGGSRVVRSDRRQRRVLLKTTLSRLRDDRSQPNELRQLAEVSLLELLRI